MKLSEDRKFASSSSRASLKQIEPRCFSGGPFDGGWRKIADFMAHIDVRERRMKK